MTLSTFELHYNPLTMSVNVSLKSELDYETTTTYTFSLVCSDEVYIATTQVTVNVLPVNDNVPQFEQEHYEFSVNRADIVPTVIGKVRATDNDSVIGGTLAFSLHGSGALFSIDSDTGEISLTNSLSNRDGNILDFSVSVSDGEYETRAGVRMTVRGVLSVVEWACVGTGITVLLVILVFVSIFIILYCIINRW